MKRRFKLIAVTVIAVMLISFACVGLSACNLSDVASRNLNMIAEQFANILLGDNVFNWNVFALDPENSFGHTRTREGEWYSYSPSTAEDMADVYSAFSFFDKYLKRISTKKLNSKDMATYNSMRSALDSYMAYYGSEYVLQFELMSGKYITAEGGYVADFTTSVENFEFRDKTDLDALLPVILSTKEAFESYIQFVSDRMLSGHPLYDYTINAMQEYLSEILEMGDEYYLYGFMNARIDSLSFLSEVEKATYKSNYERAIKFNFFEGVKNLRDGLEPFKGRVINTSESYLASFGEAGMAYYKWSFENKTGLRNVNIAEEYTKLLAVYDEYGAKMRAVTGYVESIKDTKPQVYAEFNAYMNGEKRILDLDEPQAMLEYLKTASKAIVPDLAVEPVINFKNMDETVGKRTNTKAYYLLSPLDAVNTPEHITLNSYYIENNSDDPLLLTIAHEGYPGHLYAHVRAKEQGSSMLTLINTTDAFVEGWAVYTEFALLDNIANSTESEALKLYCEYNKYLSVVGFVSPVLSDMNINYFGMTVDDLVENGNDREYVLNLMQTLMEMPTTYVSYGYGIYYMVKLHNQAKSALDGAYSEVEFNGLLLSEGMGPTLSRAQEITDNYIRSKK